MCRSAFAGAARAGGFASPIDNSSSIDGRHKLPRWHLTKSAVATASQRKLSPTWVRGAFRPWCAQLLTFALRHGTHVSRAPSLFVGRHLSSDAEYDRDHAPWHKTPFGKCAG